MIFKIAVVLWASILHVEVHSYTSCPPGPFRSYSDWSRFCKVSAGKVRDETWYQEEAVLNVLDGILTVELLQIDSRPRSLNADGKRIVELNRGFARISSLERFSLEDNLIERIDGSVFEGLSQLVYLSLAQNRIEYLEKNSFQGLDKLEILNLNQNSLKFLSDSITDDVLPALRKLYLEDNLLKTISHNYNPQTRLCHSRLEYLYLANNSITEFHGGNPLCLNNLNHLYLEDNQIRGFSIGDFPLQILSLDGNELQNIPTITPRLKFLSLARNRIKNIDNIRNAENLIGLILSYNTIHYLRFDEECQNFPVLEHLILDHNSLMGPMPFEFPCNLTSLRNLDLTGNKISSPIVPKLFANLPNLEKLLLGDNKLSSFPGNESFAESKLSYLDLSNNKIKYVSDLQANMIPKLKVLKLSGNPSKFIEPHSVTSNTTIIL